MAAPFDEQRLELAGDAVPVAEQIDYYRHFGFFSASTNGVLVYRKGSGRDFQPTWLDRQGKVLGVVGEPGFYTSVALSPDGTRAAVVKQIGTERSRC